MKFQQGSITVPTTRMCELHHLQTATSQDKPAPYNEDPDNCGSHYLECFLRSLGFKIAGILQDTLWDVFLQDRLIWDSLFSPCLSQAQKKFGIASTQKCAGLLFPRLSPNKWRGKQLPNEKHIN